jgi:rod shape-determining protein MreD
MNSGVWQKLDQAGRNVAPFAVTMLLLLIGAVPLQLPGYGTVAPALGLMAVYYWAIHRPDLLRPGFAFALGVLQDLLSGAPLGMTALIYVLVYWVVLTRRRVFLATTFPMLWLGFALVALAAAAVRWAGHSLLDMALIPPGQAFVQALLTVALFPVFGWLFIRVHRAFLQV